MKKVDKDLHFGDKEVKNFTITVFFFIKHKEK